MLPVITGDDAGCTLSASSLTQPEAGQSLQVFIGANVEFQTLARIVLHSADIVIRLVNVTWTSGPSCHTLPTHATFCARF